MENKKSYYAIIPANVRYDERLTPNAKLLYGEITALCNDKGYCWANNEYFSKLYNVSKNSITNWIKCLVDFGYLTSELKYVDGSKQILGRYIKIIGDPTQKNFDTPTQKNFVYNNTLINNTINNILVEDKPQLTYKLCVDFWLKEFHIGWSFNATSGKSLKSIITKIEKILKDSGKEITPEIVLDFFKVVCLKLPDWFKDKDLQVLNSKFNEILTQIKNTHNGKTNSSKQSAFRKQD